MATVWICHNLFIHSPVDRIQVVYNFPLLETGSNGYFLFLFLGSAGSKSARIFSLMRQCQTVQQFFFYIPIGSIWNIIFASLKGMKCYLIVFIICITLITRKVHIFSYDYCPSESPLLWITYSYSLLIFLVGYLNNIGVSEFPWGYWNNLFRGVYYIFWILTLCYMHCKVFSPLWLLSFNFVSGMVINHKFEIQM